MGCPRALLNRVTEHLSGWLVSAGDPLTQAFVGHFARIHTFLDYRVWESRPNRLRRFVELKRL